MARESRADVYRVAGAPSGTKRRQRVYQQWQGNETFFCWGHLVAGPNWRASLGTAFLLLAPTGIFLAFVAPYVTRETNAAIMVFSCLLPALCALFLFLTACRDPGIIPRQEPDEEYLQGRKPRTQEVVVNGHRVIIRYNDTCHFYQPPRAHHCSVNDNCIERFDHHCPWVGTTIGKRNYRTFLLFVFSATALCLYVMGVSLAKLFLRHNELVDDNKAAGGDGSGQWGQALGSSIPALVLMGYSFLFLWFVGGLSGFHCYLTATNQTTYENFRYNHDTRPNPFNKGLLANCAEVWCTKVPPSQVDFRAFTDERPKPAQGSMELVPPQPQPGMGVIHTDGNGNMVQPGSSQLQFQESVGYVHRPSESYRHSESFPTNVYSLPQISQGSYLPTQPLPPAVLGDGVQAQQPEYLDVSDRAGPLQHGQVVRGGPVYHNHTTQWPRSAPVGGPPSNAPESGAMLDSGAVLSGAILSGSTAAWAQPGSAPSSVG